MKSEQGDTCTSGRQRASNKARRFRPLRKFDRKSLEPLLRRVSSIRVRTMQLRHKRRPHNVLALSERTGPRPRPARTRWKGQGSKVRREFNHGHQYQITDAITVVISPAERPRRNLPASLRCSSRARRRSKLRALHGMRPRNLPCKAR